MHFKSLHNFLLIVLCTIGIGFASAPPAAAALTITNGNGTAIADPNYFAAVSTKDNVTTVDANYSKDGCRKLTVKVSGATGEITPTLALQKNLDGGNTNILIYYVPKNVTQNTARVYVNFTSGTETVKARFCPTFTDASKKSSVTPKFEGVRVYPTPGSITSTITLSHTAFDLNAISSDNEWKTNGKLVRELTVTGTNVSGNITLSVSPMGNYGLTVTPTTLPSTGGKVTITYKPQTGNDVHTNPYPKLSVKAANATTQTVELRTQWNGSTHDPDVTTVPTIPAGTFDPDIYECKTFTGRTTVSLRWELKNPDKIELKSYSQSVINSELDATTKARMIAWNEAYDKYTAMTYTLFRDGNRLGPRHHLVC